jgi:hypothetical protein
MASIEGETRGKSGRRVANKITYEEIDDYIEGTIVSKGMPIRFKFDKDDIDKIQTRNWYAATGGKYIGTHVTIHGIYKILYLHNFVMNKLTFEGIGQKETIDHINRDGLDNRKSNLRLVSQTVQNINQKKKPRTSEISLYYDLPKHVTYVKARGNHGDGFCIEFRKEGKKIYNPYIRSKVVSIEEKLEKIKILLEKGYELFPEYRPL